MKKPRPTRPKAIKERAAQTAQATAPASALAAEEKKPPFNPVRFINEVRAEGRKITWTGRKETWITSVMVFIMVAITATFFVVLDLGLSAALDAFLNLATRSN